MIYFHDKFQENLKRFCNTRTPVTYMILFLHLKKKLTLRRLWLKFAINMSHAVGSYQSGSDRS